MKYAEKWPTPNGMGRHHQRKDIGMNYQEKIERLAPDLNAAGVEASMRIQFGTLDHLTADNFVEEIAIARQCERQAPGYLDSLAVSMAVLKQSQKEEGPDA